MIQIQTYSKDALLYPTTFEDSSKFEGIFTHSYSSIPRLPYDIPVSDRYKQEA
jgi:hypothetical protein